MNPDLIKHDIDGEEYSNATPTLGTLMVAHYSTPEAHRKDIYEADAGFFAAYPERRVYLRLAFAGEFDIGEDSNRPLLWIQVTKLSEGFHQILPVWRGRAYWSGKHAGSDEGVAKLLLEFAKRFGMSLGEWQSYIFDQRSRKGKITKKSKTKAELIH